jgi:hypothetical protein
LEFEGFNILSLFLESVGRKTDEQVLTVTPRSHFRGTDSITQVANVMSRKLMMMMMMMVIIIIIIIHQK